VLRVGPSPSPLPLPGGGENPRGRNPIQLNRNDTKSRGALGDCRRQGRSSPRRTPEVHVSRTSGHRAAAPLDQDMHIHVPTLPETGVVTDSLAVASLGT